MPRVSSGQPELSIRCVCKSFTLFARFIGYVRYIWDFPGDQDFVESPTFGVSSEFAIGHQRYIVCGDDGVRITIWSILPVVICLSQRISHASLSVITYGGTTNGSLKQLRCS